MSRSAVVDQSAAAPIWELQDKHSGPLQGLRVLEFGGLGPGPFAGMMLSDLGASVLLCSRAQAGETAYRDGRNRALNRGRITIGLDLKDAEGQAIALALVRTADVVVEGYRPGVMEKLGLGPDRCSEVNPRLVYARATGWGQAGPLAGSAGHDLSYIALAGVLFHVGRAGAPPVPPLNLVGDFGGGGMLAVVGILAALAERERSGKGQTVDAAMVDGAALLMSDIRSTANDGQWDTQSRGMNALDSGAFNYNVYETLDHKYVAISALERRFLKNLAARLAELEGDSWLELPDVDQDRGFAMLTKLFASRTRDEWEQLLQDADCCFAPVLSMDEAPSHPHNHARGTFVGDPGKVQAAPAPRFSRTPGAIGAEPAAVPRDTRRVLTSLGYSSTQIADLTQKGVVA